MASKNQVVEDSFEKQESNDQKDPKNKEAVSGLPVREQLSNLEEIMEQINLDLLFSRKEMNNLYSEFNAVKLELEQKFDQINQKITSEKAKLITELKRGAENFQHNIDFLNQQIVQLQADKVKVEETTNLLDLRVEGVEVDVGFRFVYD